MIKGVQTKHLVTHHDQRGHFRELIRASDDFFSEGFAQWSESLMYTGTVKAWHIHQRQIDWWYASEGVAKAVLCDLRNTDLFRLMFAKSSSHIPIGLDAYAKDFEFSEYILGGLNDPVILKIPPGMAHGLKVLQGPAKLHYITSREYDPDDEGRIPFDALGYDWDKRDIR